MLGGSSGGLGHGSGDRSGTAFGEDDAIDACAVGGAEKSAEVVGVFNAVERKEEAILAIFFGGEEIFDGEEFALADDSEDALMRVGAGEAGELVAGLDGDPDASGAAELSEAFELLIPTLAGDADVI